jgi:hypothetical protein
MRIVRALERSVLGPSIHSYIRNNPSTLQEESYLRDQSKSLAVDHSDYPDQPGRIPTDAHKKNLKKEKRNRPTKQRLKESVLETLNSPKVREVVGELVDPIHDLVRPNYVSRDSIWEACAENQCVDMPQKKNNNNNNNKKKVVAVRPQPANRRNNRVRRRFRRRTSAYRSLAAPAATGNVFSAVGNGPTSVVITKKEFVANVQAVNGNYDVDEYPIQPGLPDLFPWLSNIASAWDKYRFLRLAFAYRNSCATSEAGRIIITYEPNSSAPTPASKLLQLQAPVQSVITPWASGGVPVPRYYMDQGGSAGWYFTRNSTVSQSLGLFDVGKLQLATEGVSTNALGELWVEYSIMLSQQQALPNPVSARISVTSNATYVFASTYTSTGDTTHFGLDSSGSPAPTNTFMISRSGQFYATWSATGYTTLSAMSMALAQGSGSVTVRDAAIFNSAATAGSVSYSVVVNSVNPDIPFYITFATTCVGGGSNIIRFSEYARDLT